MVIGAASGRWFDTSKFFSGSALASTLAHRQSQNSVSFYCFDSLMEGRGFSLISVKKGKQVSEHTAVKRKNKVMMYQQHGIPLQRVVASSHCQRSQQCAAVRRSSRLTQGPHPCG